MKHNLLIVPALIAFLLTAPAAAQVQETTLFKAPDAANSAALSLCRVNNNGVVASSAVYEGVFKPYLMVNGEFRFLQTLAGHDGVFPPSLNGRADVVGLSYKPGAGFMERVGTIWKGGGMPAPLPLPVPSVQGNPIYFEPVAINATGIIIGYSIEQIATQQFDTKALILRGGVFTEVPSPTLSAPQVIDINDSGDILVQVFEPIVGSQFYLLRGGSYTHVDIPDARHVHALNNRGHILASDANEDYIYFADGQSTVYPKLLGAQSSFLRSLTNHGVTCGSAVSYTALQDILTNNFLMRFRP